MMRRQLVGPVGDARPLRRIEELLRRDVQRVAVDVRSAADACAAEDEHIVQVLDPLDPVQLRRGEPQEVRQIPLGLRDVLVFPAPAGLHDADPVALLRGAQRGDAAAEARADDHHVVVEARHERSPDPSYTVIRASVLDRHLNGGTFAARRVCARRHTGVRDDVRPGEELPAMDPCSDVPPLAGAIRIGEALVLGRPRDGGELVGFWFRRPAARGRGARGC